MITIKTLAWSNAFSYGADNTIDFSAAQLTQLVGKNGHGKSSIALILEEVLFNKNSKSIKKADIINRYVDDKHYEISLVFEKDGVADPCCSRLGDINIETAVVLYGGAYTEAGFSMDVPCLPVFGLDVGQDSAP